MLNAQESAGALSVGDLAPEAINLPEGGGGVGFAGLQGGVQAGAELLRGLDVGLVCGGLGGVGQGFDLASLKEVLAAVRGFNAVDRKLHVGCGGGFSEAGSDQAAMELAQCCDPLVKGGYLSPLPCLFKYWCQFPRGFLRLHDGLGLDVTEEDLNMRHGRGLVVRQEDRDRVEGLPLPSVDLDGSDGAAANGREEDLLLTEADGVELL